MGSFKSSKHLWILPEIKNAKSLVKALCSFGFASLDLSEEDFLKPDYVIQLGYPPNRIDLLTSLTGVDFDKCYSSKLELEIDALHINFIDLENLKNNKLAMKRYQNLADLENLK